MDYIPKGETQRLQWLQGFSRTLSANPGRFGQVEAVAAQVAAAVADATDAMGVVAERDNRTVPNVTRKSQTLAAATGLCRLVGQQVKLNAGVTPADLQALGLRPSRTDRTPIYCPTRPPALSIVGAMPGSQTLRYNDSIDPSQRGGLPAGADCLLLFLAVADAPVRDVAAARLVGKFSRNPMGVGFDAADNGRTATYFAQWAGRRNGDVGPISAPQSMVIAA